MSTADDCDELSAPSPAPNRTPFTPRCRTVGLKRKSAGTPSLHANNVQLKRTKTAEENVPPKCAKAAEAKRRVEFDDARAELFEPVSESEAAVRRSVADKRREIEALKSELKNSEQHDLNQIQELSNKWLLVCQEALISLYDQLNKNQNFTQYSMEDLITNLGIKPDLIHFDSNTQEFNQN